VTAWDDVVLGRIEYPNKEIEDLVLLRSDGRPTYNFASPIEDVQDRITHVLRGPDHVANTPKQINILLALGAELPVYGHVPNVNGNDGKKLSKRHGAVTVDEFRRDGYFPDALVNYLALLGWSYDDKTTIMSRQELVERFTLERIGASPATFDYEKLDWLNETVRATVPLVQEKIEKLSQYPDMVRFLFEPVAPPDGVDARICRAAHDRLTQVDPWEAAAIEGALRELAEELGEKPRQAFAPIRLAITGATISPGLFESLELLGKEASLQRLSAAAAAASAA
jgi:glutamyl-tRNA synthetase